MKKIEKTAENMEYIKRLYEENKVIFDCCILKSDKLEYFILFTPKMDIYDVVIKDYKDNILINYEDRKKLSSSTLKYFNLFNGDKTSDMFGNEFICLTHYVEYE